ncbi:MAG TPA: CinA family protein, partial [Bradyrhizobium sp.]
MAGSDARALSRSLLDLCRMRKLTIATAESCTGGLVAGA